MSFLSDIRNLSSKQHHLKHVDAPVERQFLTEGTCTNDEDYDQLLSDASMENYLSVIEPFTFKSRILPISIEECQALVAEHEKFKQFRLEYVQTKCTEKAHAEEQEEKQGVNIRSCDYPEYSSWKEVEILKLLANRIQKVIDEEERVRDDGSSDFGVFVRLSTISPKDAVINRTDFLDCVQKAENEYISHLETVENVDFLSELNRRVYALYIAGTTGMKVRSGDYAVQLFIESERTKQEFQSKLKHSSDSNDENKVLNIIVREWNDFDVALEFRAFVHKRRLTAMTQYNPFVLFPHLIKQRDAIGNLCKDFVENQILTQSNLRMESFIVDLLLVLKPGCKLTDSVDDLSQKYQVKVIELNPFAEFAGTGLFSLSDDIDLLQGTNPDHQFTFRMVEQLPKFVAQQLEPSWSQFL